MTFKELRYFIQQRNIWLEQTKFCSNPIEICSNPAYLNIINMGADIIPYIIKDLNKNDNFWFDALSRLTGVNPIQKKNAGIFLKMKEDWLNYLKIC
ncbi:hypothetical protein M0Q97_08925 [Candidatus Dojkabacteria bacterium]|jgi:hypothetical protein|nr:hypothetical protein [Candidatus Dojkabacteria bacterium]